MKNNKNLSKTNQGENQQIVAQSADSGRSMVEMLGTLAVIGVLSIAGITGYKYAMTRYQVNTIVNEVNLLSNQISMVMNNPHTGEYELSLGNPYDNEQKLVAADYNFTYGCGDSSKETDVKKCSLNDTKYHMILNNVPLNICQSLQGVAHNFSYLDSQKVNEGDEGVLANCKEENNKIVWSFNASSDENTGEKDNAMETDKPSDEITCLNGGTSNGVDCDCPNGYSGANCSIIDCKNGGTWNGSKCDCPSGYSGADCGTILCQNGGTSNGVECDCPSGYLGFDCSIINCQNGGTWNGSKCDCPSGYSGADCGTIICKNGGTWNGFGCDCIEYYMGTDCSVIDCKNGGTWNGSKCDCPIGTSDPDCSMILAWHCISDESCNNFFDRNDLTCKTGTHEDDTIMHSMGCFEKQAICLNGGAWEGDRCICPTGYSGTLCENKDRDCLNGGTLDGDRCICPTGYYGPSCEFIAES